MNIFSVRFVTNLIKTDSLVFSCRRSKSDLKLVRTHKGRGSVSRPGSPLGRQIPGSLSQPFVGKPQDLGVIRLR